MEGSEAGGECRRSEGGDGLSDGQVILWADGVNRESQVNQARCAAGMGGWGVKGRVLCYQHVKLVVPCTRWNLGPFSVNIKNIAFCHKSIP